MSADRVNYIHRLEQHNKTAAYEIVPYLVSRFSPRSVVDVGCGLGTWLAVFKEKGVNDLVGIDGDHVDRKLLFIPESDFLVRDLRKQIGLTRRFDLVLSLEVAEHLPEESAISFVNELVKLGDRIIFSAAIPGQGGQHHLNEQYPHYWQRIFNNVGYEMKDEIRFQFWENENVEVWYKQNIFLVEKSEKNSLSSVKAIVHPLLFEERLKAIHALSKELENLTTYNNKIMSGKIGVRQSVAIVLKALGNWIAKIF